MRKTVIFVSLICLPLLSACTFTTLLGTTASVAGTAVSVGAKATRVGVKVTGKGVGKVADVILGKDATVTETVPYQDLP
ncbi:MAG: hypothetical protein COA47_15095 [Robiginitomaculum sp.]|nr:MAG: hypothetical protein COA47_15095 [Robiginitomaculum sp.]